MPSSSITWLSQSPVSSSWNEGRAGSGTRPLPRRVTRGASMIGAKSPGAERPSTATWSPTRTSIGRPAHLHENAFLGVLHEQQRPGGVDVGDDAFDPHGAAERGGIADTNLGDAGQN